MSKYGKLPELAEEIERRVGKHFLARCFSTIWEGLHAHGELWLDSLKTEDEIDKCGQFRAIVEEGWERGRASSVSSTNCVWIISAWEAMGEPNAVEMMAKWLISLEKEPISALALVGEYLT